MTALTTFTPVAGIVGGVLIGLATVAWLWLYGRVTGISGIVHGAAFGGHGQGEHGWRWFYLAGLIAGMLLYTWVLVPAGLPGPHFHVDLQGGWPLMLVAGFLVGFGTRMGNGCTSGHGVCGLSRLSPRSLVATVTFILFGFLSAAAIRPLLGV
jgi:uncharacterized membrane protein YedE/YeeE